MRAVGHEAKEIFARSHLARVCCVAAAAREGYPDINKAWRARCFGWGENERTAPPSTRCKLHEGND